jgi:hypothetical protein
MVDTYIVDFALYKAISSVAELYTYIIVHVGRVL